MKPSIQRKFTALVISLAIQVISLTGLAGAATMPSVTVLPAVTDSVRAPNRVAVDPAGNFYVSDTRAGGVLVYSKYGAYVKTILTAASPKGVAYFGTAPNGKVVVSQGTFAAVYNVNTGAETLRFGTGYMTSSDGIAVDSAGYFWVADAVDGGLRVFNSTGGVVNWYTGIVGMATDLKFVSVGGVDRLALVDAAGGDGTAVKILRLTGTTYSVEKSLGTVGAAAGWVSTPMAVALEKSADGLSISRVYILDAFQGNWLVHDYATGAYLGVAGSYGRANGQLMIPTGMEFNTFTKDAGGQSSVLLVANGFGNVTVYGIDGGTFDAGPLPVVTTTNPNPDTINTPTYALSGTVTSTSTPVFCSVSLNGGAAQPAVVTGATSPFGWSITLSGYGFGSNNYKVTCRNPVGPTEVPGSFTYNDVNGVTIDSTPAYTNKTNLLVTGTKTTGSAVTVTNANNGYDSSVNGTVSYPTDTTWTCLVPIGAGSNTINATATKENAPAAPAPSPVTVIFDAVPPVLSVSTLSTGSATSTQLLNVSGTTSDNTGQPVTITVNGVAAAVYSNGIFNAPVILVNGTNQVDVRATDAGGNEVLDTRFITFDFDPTRPAVTVTQPTDVLNTDVPSVTVSGSVVNAATISVAGTPVAIDGGNWTTSAPVALLPGMNTIEIVATGLTGKTSSVKRTVYYNASKPALALTTPATDFAAKNPALDVFGTVGGGAASVQCCFNGACINPAVTAGAFSFNVPFTPESNYDVYCKALDGLNTVLTSLTRTLVYDKTAPALTVDATTSAAPTVVTGTVEAGGKVNVQAWNGPYGSSLVGKTSLNNAGTYSIDLTGVTYDAGQLLICAADVANNTTCLTPNPVIKDCDYNLDGISTTMDALLIMRDVVNNVTPTAQQLAHADVGPLVNGGMNPNGGMDMSDALICLKAVTGTPIPGIEIK